MGQRSWRGSCGMAHGRVPCWVVCWEGVGGSWHCTQQSGGAVSSGVGSWVPLGLLGPFVIPQPLLRCHCWRRTLWECDVPRGCATVPAAEEGGWATHCLSLRWLLLQLVREPLTPSLSPPPPQPAPPPSLPQAGAFLAPGGAFNPFSVSCEAGAWQRARLPVDGCPHALRHQAAAERRWPVKGRVAGGRGRGGIQCAAGAEAMLATTNPCDSAPEHLPPPGTER